MKIQLRKFSKSDYLKFLRLKTGRETRDEFQKSLFGYVLEGVRNLIDRERAYKFSILCEGQFCGYGLVYNIRNFYEIGIFVIPRYRGKGIATDVARRLINYSYKKLKMKKIMATTDEDKKDSQKILKNLGFKLVKKNKRDNILIYEKELKEEKWK